MNKRRKVNEIRALKRELSLYKRQPVPVKEIYLGNLKHLRCERILSREEFMQMPKELVLPILQRKIAKAFEDVIMEFPIEIKFDEDFGVYRANLDLWVKPKGFQEVQE